MSDDDFHDDDDEIDEDEDDIDEEYDVNEGDDIDEEKPGLTEQVDRLFVYLFKRENRVLQRFVGIWFVLLGLFRMLETLRPGQFRNLDACFMFPIPLVGLVLLINSFSRRQSDDENDSDE